MKDVIYIDVEDDITAIIGKVKASKEKIVALVPPKRIGVLQSAVNLRLLDRAASHAEKRLVLITNNQALVGLAAAASIPVAKNLQSKPEIAEIPALEIDDGDDVIDGAQLPVGEHAKQVGKTVDDVEEEPPVLAPLLDDSIPTKSAMPAAKAGKKVPNFNSFRKRLFLIIAGAVLLIGGLVWAFVFAPAATVVITAKTTPVTVNSVARMTEITNVESGTIKAEVQTIERDESVEFLATGEKDVGEKATGTVRLTSDSFSALMVGITIPAGTKLTSSSGKEYLTDAAVTLSTSGNTKTTGITAAESGASYNGASGSMSGAPSTVNAAITGGATAGGTDKKVPMVTAADVQAASEKLVAQSTDAVKSELQKKFGSDVNVIIESFVADRAAAAPSPAIGAETGEDKKATLTSKVTYRMTGISSSELSNYLEASLKAQMTDQKTQKVYKSGSNNLKLTEYKQTDNNTVSIRIAATGQIGPIIKEDDIKKQVAGKKFGDIQQQLNAIEGINDVKVNFSFFWVRTVPNNLDKITVEFTVEDA